MAEEKILYLVEVERTGYPRHHALFSTADRAAEWVMSIPDKTGSLLLPLVLDDPRCLSVEEEG